MPAWGWSKDPGPPNGGGIPRHYFLLRAEKILSGFIDDILLYFFPVTFFLLLRLFNRILQKDAMPAL